MKTITVHGVEMTTAQEMAFSKWLSNNRIAMNTKSPSQRTEIVFNWLREINEPMTKVY